MNFKVGDSVLFDHFGSVNRPGTIVKVTATKVHIQWTAPSSGATRVVPVGLYETTYGTSTYPAQAGPADKNVRVRQSNGEYAPLEVR